MQNNFPNNVEHLLRMRRKMMVVGGFLGAVITLALGIFFTVSGYTRSPIYIEVQATVLRTTIGSGGLLWNTEYEFVIDGNTKTILVPAKLGDEKPNAGDTARLKIDAKDHSKIWEGVPDTFGLFARIVGPITIGFSVLIVLFSVSNYRFVKRFDDSATDFASSMPKK